MGFIVIFIGGIIGVFTALKMRFAQSWIFFINMLFSIYAAVFLAPLFFPLLKEIPGISGYGNSIAVGGGFLVINFILKKIAEQVFPNSENELSLPAFSKIFSCIFGFLSGCFVISFVLYIFLQFPFSNNFPSEQVFRAASSKTLISAIHTVHSLSFQSFSLAAEDNLRNLRLLPKKKLPEPQTGKKTNKSGSAQPQGKQKKSDADASVKPSEAKADTGTESAHPQGKQKKSDADASAKPIPGRNPPNPKVNRKNPMPMHLQSRRKLKPAPGPETVSRTLDPHCAQ